MGLFDAARDLFGGAGRTTVAVQLPPGEVEQIRVVAAALVSGLSKVGGDLIVTNRRILFTPLNTGAVSTLLKAGLKLADAPAGATALVGWLQRQIDGSAASLDQVVRVTAGSDGSRLKPPTIVFSLFDGRRVEFGVLAHRMAPTGSAQNQVVRDQFVAALSR